MTRMPCRGRIGCKICYLVKTVLFIVNPKAGKGRNLDLDNLARQNLDSRCFKWSVAWTQYAGHAEILAREADADIVVAVGGDGTVNEVARGLVGSDKTLGIIPCGSGNGLAFHYGLSADPKKAMNLIASGTVHQMDYGTVCGHPFFCTCGVGMDAEVSSIFASGTKRGLWSYVKDTVREICRYSPEIYHIETESESFDVGAALITVANANQWGNNAFIAPGASTSDGLFDITIVKPFSFPAAAPLAVRLFDGTICKDRHILSLKAKRVTIVRNSPGWAHYDGDPVMLDKKVEITLEPEKLNVLV